MAAGGSLGALARVAIAREFPVHAGSFPWTTFVINVAGCVILAYVATRLLERLPPSTYRRPAIGTGFCGALTTFSTLQVELSSCCVTATRAWQWATPRRASRPASPPWCWRPGRCARAAGSSGMSAATWIGVAVLGALGACGRFTLDGLVERRSGLGYPWARSR